MLFYRAALPLSRSTQQDPLVLAVRREALLLPGSLGRPALSQDQAAAVAHRALAGGRSC